MEDAPSLMEPDVASTAYEVVQCVQQLNQPDLPHQQRRVVEQWLLAFRGSQQAWLVCLQCLQHCLDPAVRLFAAQTLRHKVNQEGSRLPQDQLLLLRQHLLQHIAWSPTQQQHPQPQQEGHQRHADEGVPMQPALLQQLCLALCSVTWLLPAWADVPASLHGWLPFVHELTLLQLLAEEAATDLRHVTPPQQGPTGQGASALPSFDKGPS